MTDRTLPDTDRLKITVLDEPGSGGPTHQHSCLYEIKGMDGAPNPAWDGLNQHKITLTMQCGPVSDGKPPNGLTEEALLAIVEDRMLSLGWDKVLEHIREARKYLSSERAKAV